MRTTFISYIQHELQIDSWSPDPPKWDRNRRSSEGQAAAIYTPYRTPSTRSMRKTNKTKNKKKYEPSLRAIITQSQSQSQCLRIYHSPRMQETSGRRLSNALPPKKEKTVSTYSSAAHITVLKPNPPLPQSEKSINNAELYATRFAATRWLNRGFS